jgi:hypothetical protein
MKLVGITCTTPSRGSALTLCERYMGRQTRPLDEWIVVNDDRPMIDKVAEVLPRVQGDAVLFIEDDDWYHPAYVDWMQGRLLQGYSIVGQGLALYYNVAYRWWSECHNKRHASLCNTAITPDLFEAVCNIIADFNCPWIDTQMWHLECRRFLHLPKDGERLLIGIKGMFESGYSTEHRQVNPKGTEPDPDLSKLRELIGEDAEAYAPYHTGEEELLRLAGAL